ncbi:MAG: hypothetical protein K8T91_24145 [Planctomycetes bacterium]|nr:hypothetical protein [Planctomycetota bacterium]
MFGRIAVAAALLSVAGGGALAQQNPTVTLDCTFTAVRIDDRSNTGRNNSTFHICDGCTGFNGYGKWSIQSDKFIAVFPRIPEEILEIDRYTGRASWTRRYGDKVVTQPGTCKKVEKQF